MQRFCGTAFTDFAERSTTLTCSWIEIQADDDTSLFTAL
jgi:hypothetical protein